VNGIKNINAVLDSQEYSFMRVLIQNSPDSDLVTSIVKHPSYDSSNKDSFSLLVRVLKMSFKVNECQECHPKHIYFSYHEHVYD